MKYYSEKSLGARLQQAEEAIIIGQTNSELSEALAERGYSEATFTDGASRVAMVKSIDASKREQLGAQVVATAAMEEATRKLRNSFETDRRIVRLAIDGNEMYLDQLRLKERASTKGFDFVLQVGHFYKQLKEHVEVMNLAQDRYNFTEDIIVARQGELAELEEALRNQQYLIGQLHDMTKQRREAMDEVDAWMKGFIATARIAFKDDFPKLQKLGIHVRRQRSRAARPVPDVELSADDNLNLPVG